MVNAEHQKIINEAKSRAINAIEADFAVIQDYFERDVSLARFATDKKMTIWQFKWLLNKHKIPPKAKKFRDRRETRQITSSFEDAHTGEDGDYETIPANVEDDFSGL